MGTSAVDLDSLIAARRKAVAQSGNVDLSQPPGHETQPLDLDKLIAERRALVEEAKPGLLDRVVSGVGGAISQAITHPIDTAESLIVAPVKSAIDAVLTPEEGEARPSAALSKGGNSSGRPIDTSAYDAEHGAQPKGARKIAALQTVVNVAAPGAAGVVGRRLGGAAAAATVGAMGGAAYSPEDPVAGALTGAIVAPLAHGVAKSVPALHSGITSVGGGLIDLAGKRPETTQPIARIAGREIGSIEGVQERATRLNRERLPAIQPPATDKPLAPVDLGGIEAQRLARGLKTASPAAEKVLRDALHPRADAAVDRVIQHGLETTGLTDRESGLSVVDDLIAQRAEHGRENYQPIFQKYSQPIDNPTFDRIIKTPAGQQALRRGATIASNRGETIGSLADDAAPPGISPESWANMKRLAAERGMSLPSFEGQRRIAPTLQQAHFIKLGFDDLLRSAPEPGSGGTGPNNAAAIRGLKNHWLQAMDQAAPEYQQGRKVFADESDLIRAGELGRKLFSMHPDEAKKAFGEMSAAERDVARRTGFDALAQRIENGPKDVEGGVSKPRDQARMRLLFPDDESFQRFKHGLSEEAQMHATTQGVLGGSNTADKLADMAGMAGISIPDVFRAARGNPLPLIKKGAMAVARKAGATSFDRIAAERARQLVAGADGNLGARTETLRGMGTQFGGDVESTPADRRPPARRMLPAGRFESGEQQGAAMPIPQPLPKNRRLGPGVTYPAVTGDVPHGTAMPIRQPLPLNRRLPSGGPAAVATTGELAGPGIPMPPVDIESIVRAEAMRRYRENPRKAVAMTREEQDAFTASLREAALQGRVESAPGPKSREHASDEYFDITSGNAKAPELRARTDGGTLKSFNKASNAELVAEYRALIDANAVENMAPTSLEDVSGGGPQYVGKKKAAAHATGRVVQRQKSIAKVEAELKARGIDPLNALTGDQAVQHHGDPTDFDFGSNVR